jgi:hypothetical protein
LTIEADAEASNSEYMENLRKHDEKMKMAGSLRSLSSNG